MIGINNKFALGDEVWTLTRDSDSGLATICQVCVTQINASVWKSGMIVTYDVYPIWDFRCGIMNRTEDMLFGTEEEARVSSDSFNRHDGSFLCEELFPK